jgi:type II secretory pathway pseudopilin PulG
MKTEKVITIASESRSFTKQRGFTTIQLLITIALIVVISTFALFAIDSARASVRLTGSTRELAGYLEKARSNAIRRNDESIVTIVDANSYTVTMDFDGDGNVETRTIRLQTGVTFTADMIGITARFDWRGRVPSQIGFRLINERGTPSSINLSGAGDVTIGTDVFQDGDIGEITLNANPSPSVASGSPGIPAGDDPHASPSPSPVEEASPSPSPGEDPSPTDNPSPSPSPTAEADPSPDASPSPSAVPTASPSPSPTLDPCVLSAPTTLSLPRNGSPKTFSVVTITNARSTVLTATATGDITALSPTTTTVSGSGTISYTISYANGSGRSGTVTISSSCGSKTIAITFD